MSQIELITLYELWDGVTQGNTLINRYTSLSQANATRNYLNAQGMTTLVACKSYMCKKNILGQFEYYSIGDRVGVATSEE